MFPDWQAIGNAGLEGLAFGFLFFGVAYLLFSRLAFEILGSPVVQAVGRAAARFVAMTGKGEGGDWKGIVAKGGMKILERWFGGGGEGGG